MACGRKKTRLSSSDWPEAFEQPIRFLDVLKRACALRLKYSKYITQNYDVDFVGSFLIF